MTEVPRPFPGFSTAEMDHIWSAAGLVTAMLEFEAALALALGDTGLAPRDAADAAAEACGIDSVADPGAILASTWETGTPVIALVGAVRERLEKEEERRWVHFGATSQDVIDSAMMLQARAALSVIERSLLEICRSLAELVTTYRSQPEVGWTFLQHAGATTFGRRVAGWLEPTLGHVRRIRETRDRLPVQLGGPVGTTGDYGEAAPDVVAALAGRLGLAVPTLPWHADRSPIWALVHVVEGPVRTCAKIATDIALLAQSDVAEVTVRAGGSSSMPGKRNPIDATRALAAAEACRGAASMIQDAPPHPLDRAIGAWHAEWFALPLLFQTASAVLESVEHALEGMAVTSESMASRAGADRDDGSKIAIEAQIAAVLDVFRELTDAPLAE